MKDDKVLLSHMLDAIKQIETYVKAGEEAFQGDRMIQDAVLRNFEVLGEAAKGLSLPLIDRHLRFRGRKLPGCATS